MRIYRERRTANLSQMFHKQLPGDAVLGVGLFGRVWRALNEDTGETFAVKNLSEQYAQREIEVFQHLRNFPHPCVVGLFDVHLWNESGLVSLVMEMCPGGDLFTLIKAQRREAKTEGRVYAPHTRYQSWLAQTFLGLEFLHATTNVHYRDLKPANIIFDSAQIRCKLTDFGVSKLDVTSSGAFTFGNPAGSPGYVSPEILRQQPYSTKADWYSYGVLVWVVATGGVSRYVDPQPPTNARQLRQDDMRHGDFSALFNDFQVLQDIIRDDSGEHAPPIHGTARELVLQLVVERSADRLDANGIRLHSFMSPLNLPPLSHTGSPPDAQLVLEWVSARDG